MDTHSGPRRWRPRSLALGALLLGGLLATLILAARAGIRADWTLPALSGWLDAGSWAWPLAAALTLAAVSSPPARRRWPRPAHRIPVAIGVFAGLMGLASLAVYRPGMVVLAVGAVVVVGLLAAWVVVLPPRLVPPAPAQVLDALGDRERLEVTAARVKLQNDLRTTALQAIAGLAVLAGAVLAFQQLTEDRQQATATRELTLQGQASERFTRAIDQLGSDRREVQLGGIYGLEQIAQQAPANRLVVTEVLVAYLHRRIPRPAKPRPTPTSAEELRVRAPDAQAALTVLSRRQIAPDDPRLDLRTLDLRRAGLRRATLADADLRGADLRDADLTLADLNLADLNRADLRGATLADADLGVADLRGATLADADLNRADLRRATLADADLRGADLAGVNLGDAYLIRADLRGATLFRADLRGADLADADLRGATLAGVNLGDADLRGVDLRGAFADQQTRWPQGFDWRGAGVLA
jgi:uncharacterized protein YjbI with pentapeptide repeats